MREGRWGLRMGKVETILKTGSFRTGRDIEFL
jgi:hypothetical protein